MKSRALEIPKGIMGFIDRRALYIMLLPGIIFTIAFAYVPIFGIIMAFQRFSPVRGFLDSPFVGLDNFTLLFSNFLFWRTVRNTILLSLGKILFGVFIPIVLALLLNELTIVRIKKAIQTTLLAPYFLSWAVLAGVLLAVFSIDGLVNSFLLPMFGSEVSFFTDNSVFPWLLIFTDVWKGMGMNIVIYLAAITAIDPTLYEAAEVDGAGYFSKALHITVPSIAPIIMLLLILSLGSILNAGFEQVFMMYNPAVYESADIIDTFVYRAGIVDLQFSLSAAAGLLKSIVSFLLVCISYFIAYKFTRYRVL